MYPVLLDLGFYQLGSYGIIVPQAVSALLVAAAAAAWWVSGAGSREWRPRP